MNEVVPEQAGSRAAPLWAVALAYGAWGGAISFPILAVVVIAMAALTSDWSEDGLMGGLLLWWICIWVSVVVSTLVHLVGGWIGVRQRWLLGMVSVAMSASALPILAALFVAFSWPDANVEPSDVPIPSGFADALSILQSGVWASIALSPLALFPVLTLNWLAPAGPTPTTDPPV